MFEDIFEGIRYCLRNPLRTISFFTPHVDNKVLFEMCVIRYNEELKEIEGYFDGKWQRQSIYTIKSFTDLLAIKNIQKIELEIKND